MSHFTVTLSVAPPESTCGMIAYSKEEMDELVALRVAHTKAPKNFDIKYRLKALEEKSSPFEQDVETVIERAMSPYCECTEDPAYLEFVDVGPEYQEKYKTEATTAVRLPDGTICTIYDTQFTNHYDYKDGKVYYRQTGVPALLSFGGAGPFPGIETKEVQVLENYPFSKLYHTYEEFMRRYGGYDFDARHQSYGYYSNPNAKWDWYQVGGRWTAVFLVKDDCDLVVWGNRSLLDDDEPLEAPAGYQWVVGARKRDIQWEKMKELAVAKKQAQFQELEDWFLHGVEPTPKPSLAVRTEDGIESWGRRLYYKGESLEEYLKRHGLDSGSRYPYSSYAYIDTDGWHGQGDMGWFGLSSNDKDDDSWMAMMQSFLKAVPDDHFLVSVDCHI